MRENPARASSKDVALSDTVYFIGQKTGGEKPYNAQESNSAS
jgi:hypothetical protein